ncbi:RecX family transcriptional regulator [Flavobacteriales bacterium]|nr:RecX family transcriptional regulator [Flavobacteriales bacterium]|tara:strand:- start:270 stop:737 length:468 start_codon:yes stop_codon:yes gene_type:complete
MMNGKIFDVKIVKERIRHYCAVMDRCQFQVITKLKSYGVSDALADEILIELIQNKYLDEERFARSFCSGKFKIKRWGRNKIAFELSKLKVPKSCILLAMSEIDDIDYKNVIRHLANKKMALLKDKNSYVRKKKVVDSLLRKGYESELVWSYVHKL